MPTGWGDHHYGVACHVLFEWDKRHDEFDLAILRKHEPAHRTPRYVAAVVDADVAAANPGDNAEYQHPA